MPSWDSLFFRHYTSKGSLRIHFMIGQLSEVRRKELIDLNLLTCEKDHDIILKSPANIILPFRVPYYITCETDLGKFYFTEAIVLEEWKNWVQSLSLMETEKFLLHIDTWKEIYSESKECWNYRKKWMSSYLDQDLIQFLDETLISSSDSSKLFDLSCSNSIELILSESNLSDTDVSPDCRINSLSQFTGYESSWFSRTISNSKIFRKKIIQ